MLDFVGSSVFGVSIPGKNLSLRHFHPCLQVVDICIKKYFGFQLVIKFGKRNPLLKWLYNLRRVSASYCCWTVSQLQSSVFLLKDIWIFTAVSQHCTALLCFTIVPLPLWNGSTDTLDFSYEMRLIYVDFCNLGQQSQNSSSAVSGGSHNSSSSSSSSNLPSNLSYTSYILKQTPQVGRPTFSFTNDKCSHTLAQHNLWLCMYLIFAY